MHLVRERALEGLAQRDGQVRVVGVEREEHDAGARRVAPMTQLGDDGAAGDGLDHDVEHG